jgi:prolyl-tRNA synthetase
MARNVTPRSKDYSQWYLDVIKAAGLADYAPVRGCMVIKPWGYALWEAIQADLDRRFKDTGHVNAYFPLFIPLSYLAKESQHVEGFAMECAVVTHSGIERDQQGELTPRGALEEPLVVRPTSETVIGAMYAQWIRSWRDLPLLINQWANVVRWEMRTRLFLRTSEFLWQEGHTAHETAAEARDETLRILEIYRSFAEEVLAVPVHAGLKTDAERFAGADQTYCIEALMQDGKALQAGTSHDLGQNFAKAFGIQFQARDNSLQHVWTTSWGVSTRTIGALVMVHSDDEGLILPPRVAPTVASVIPIARNDQERLEVRTYAERLLERLCGARELERARRRSQSSEQFDVFWDPVTHQRVSMDLRQGLRPGEKHFAAEQKGIPFRFEIGPRDVKAGNVVLKSRLGEKEILPLESIGAEDFSKRLEDFQKALFERARGYRDELTSQAGSYDELKTLLKQRGGFVRCHFEPDVEVEARVKAETKATVRLILPDDQCDGSEAPCVVTGNPTRTQVLFALAY